MDEENEEQEDLTPQEGEQTPQTQTSENSSAIKEREKSTKKEIGKRLAQSIKNGAGKHSLIAALGPILLWGFVILVIIIIVIGIAMFLVTMPGMVMEQLKALFKEAGNFVAAFFGADTTKQIENTRIYSTLDYLEQMGYDLKGEGFLTDYVKSTDEIDKDAEKDNGVNLDEKIGVLRNDDDEIITAKSDFIFTYIVSDNYVYTIKNGNLATQNSADNWFEKIVTGIATAVYKYYNAIFGPVFDFLGINEAVGEKWGTGLLAFYYDNGVGVKGDYVNTQTIWNWDALEIDTESKKLLITRNEFLNNNNAMEFSLDGWTGRYGMPLEFLLAVHKATLMPDLSYDMATTFDTTVNIYLHDVSGEAITAYKTNSGYVDYPTLEEATSQFKGKNFFSALVNWFDDLIDSDAEIAAAKDLGIDIGNGENGCTCEYNTVLVDSSGENVVEEKDGKYYYKDGTEYTGSVQTVTSITKGCSQCRNKLGKIKDLLKKDNDYNFKAYNPYIANVKNHWYRDVYFVLNEGNKEFVNYDYDYEIMTGERWTLYETDDNGDFVYYKLNDDGSTGEKYEGKVNEGEVEIVKGEESESLRIASIGEDGTKVVKKAQTINSSDTEKLTDLGWNKNENGIWNAYEENTSESSTGFERLYTDEELAEDEDKAIKEKIYINVTTVGNITQTGEGQRTETNSDIKKMFLLNNYFRYDGTDSTAEIIAALREKIYSGNKKNYYGPISEDNLKREVTLNFDDAKYTAEHENGTYKVSDYAGNVSLNQDSLNAFTMLENTHTLDADYIYRDFKELIVELGYFKKEELTDETPKLLEWIVPDIGSGGYPDRTIDKRENEYGTMVHSKSDIEVNQKHTLQAILAVSPEDTEDPEGAGTEPDGNDISKLTHDTFNLMGEVASLSNTPIASLKNVASITNVQDTNYKFSSSGSTETGSKTGDLEFNGVNYEVWKQTSSTCTLYSFAFIAQAYTGESPENYLKTSSGAFINKNGNGQGGNEYWAQGAGVMWDMFDKVGISGKYYFPGDASVADEVSKALDEGKPVYFYGNLRASGNYHAVVLLGASDGGKVTYYNPGPGNVETYGASSSFATNLESLLANHFKHRIFIPDELPTGVSKTSNNPYEGYEGNEAVVSPVTGILLDYGTYENVDAEDTDATKEDPRVNVDLKYGFPNIYENISEENSGNTQGNEPEGFKSQIVSDKVGYAKILVLDAENYQKLESTTSNRWKNDSLVRIDKTDVTLENTEQVTSSRVSFREYLDGKKANKDDNYSDVYKDWSVLDKTIYGYKEFAETYEKYGIAGYVVYIDGFKCELPDESLSGGDGSDDTGMNMAEQMPRGEKLTIDSFKIGEGQLESDDVIPSEYKSDEAYKLASDTSTNKLAAEVDLKTEAASSIATDNLIFIKEGTILGRTLTDKELLESPDFRDSKYGTYEELRGEEANKASGNEDEEDNSKLIGNYLRIIMKDKDGTTVENVEDYMKLDEEKANTLGNIEQFMFWQANEPEGFEFIMDGVESYALASTAGTGGTKARRDNPSDKYGHDYAIDGKDNNDINLCPGICLQSGSAGSSGRAIYKEVVGNENIGWGVFVTGENNLEIYTKELEVVRQSVIDKVPITADWEEDDTRMFALMDVMYAGTGNFEIGTIYSKLKSGDTNLTKEDFMSNCTDANAFYRQNRTGFKRRRLIDYYMYAEGIFGHGIYGIDSEEITQRWEFSSETPFQDIMMDKTPAKLVDL